MAELRIQIRRDGSIVLPKEALDALNAGPGSYLKVSLAKGKIELEKTFYDPFAETPKGPDPDALDKIAKKQQEKLKEAEKEFFEKLKEPPELRPEDRPDFWD